MQVAFGKLLARALRTCGYTVQQKDVSTSMRGCQCHCHRREQGVVCSLLTRHAWRLMGEHNPAAATQAQAWHEEQRGACERGHERALNGFLRVIRQKGLPNNFNG